MARQTRYDNDFSYIGRQHVRDHPEMSLFESYAAYWDLSARRLVRLNSDNKMELATNNTPPPDGIPSSQAGLSSGERGFAVQKGWVLGQSYASLEAGLPIRAGLNGMVNNANVVDTGTAEVIQAALAGKSSDITDNDANDEKLKVTSTSASDTNYILFVGLDTSGNVIYEFIKATGTTAVTGSTDFKYVYGAVILDRNDLTSSTATAAVGTITVKNATTGTTLITFTAADKYKGIGEITAANRYAFDRKVKVTASALTNSPVAILVGTDYAGDAAYEKVAYAASNDILVKETTNRFNHVRFLVLGEFATTTIKLEALKTNEILTGLSANPENGTLTNLTQSAGKVVIKSDDPGDTTQTLYLYAEDGSGLVYEEISLNGTTGVDSTNTGITAVHGIYLDSATDGSVTVYKADGATVMVTLDGSSYLSLGMLARPGDEVAYTAKTIDGRLSKIDITNSNSSATDKLILEGVDDEGSTKRELLTLSSGTVTSTNRYAKITNICSINGAATEYFTVEGNETVDGDKIIGKAIQPADSSSSVEVFLKL